MAATNDSGPRDGMWIEVEADGPYTIHGAVPLVRKTQVVSEYGEPLTWQKEGDIETSGDYQLCRCGQSAEKPFCDCAHRYAEWDPTETADTRPSAERQRVIPGGTNLIVRRDDYLCMESGFCADRFAKIDQMVPGTNDTRVRSLVMAMAERCPSGAYVYRTAEGEPDIEPDLPRQIAVTTEITSDGPITGPLWVTGGIPVVRSDGQPFETRNRVTLCSCGLSEIKPLCDGTHRAAGIPASG
jgi:CDGSH-type Zn-finger protein